MAAHGVLPLPVPTGRPAPVIADLGAEAARHPAHVRTRLAPALSGLAAVADGGAFSDDGTTDGGRSRRFLGWSAHGHWMRR